MPCPQESVLKLTFRQYLTLSLCEPFPLTIKLAMCSCACTRVLVLQVMSMVPEMSLDSRRFEDAPVPEGERRFLING